TLSHRYITDRFLPDKAIDLIDEAAASLRMQIDSMPTEIDQLERRATQLEIEKQALKKETDPNSKERLATIDKELAGIREEAIARIVSKWTGIPVSKMLESEVRKLITMEERLRHRVVGQDVALERVANAIRRNRAGLSDPKRPIGSFIFLGPTGVGKTELA